ncbi:unnamed protein product [Rotaria sordida]|uniref:EGF-like domain-containing protein n=1 Tax=Rotaria sordida TaxID=392033 RepID=A0A819EY95_9BILA|nr:unnamed protein product [Rotaria sordida]CAF3858647.1 unnamed protein product [Rotaria sordida]
MKKWSPSQKQQINWPFFPFVSKNTRTFTPRRASKNSLLYAISFMCNRGIAVFEQNNISCLCPPSYYGDRCQYFSDRLTIIVQIDWTSFSLLNLTGKEFTMEVLFRFNDERIIDRYEFHLNPRFDTKKYKFYFVYSRSKDMLQHKQFRYFNRIDIEHIHPYSVRFELYSHESNQSIIELGSWYYPIFFDFLPAYRLAVVLRLPIWFGNKTLDPCLNSNITKCHRNSKCKPIFNSNNSFYCSCNYGFYGKQCNKYLSICNSYCSFDSICKPYYYGNDTKPFCICPKSHFGPSCHLHYDACSSFPCGINGTCHLTYDPSGERSYQCQCDKLFSIEKCQSKNDVHMAALYLIPQYQQVSHGIPTIVQYDHGRTLAPRLAVLKTYENYHAIGNYYLLYIQPDVSIINIPSTPELCPHASNFIIGDKVIFQYHEICRNGSFCFYDTDYLCICESDHYRAECFEHDLRLDYCDRCLSNGKCIQGNLDNRTDFICLCPHCYRGSICEFSMEVFGFTLDSLLVSDPIIVQIVYTVLAFLFTVIGFFTNFCSFFTFYRPQLRKNAVENFLLFISILNQCVIFCLFAKFLHILLGSMGMINQISCKSVNYLLSVLTRSSFWLTSCISLNRLFLILMPSSTLVKNVRLAIYLTIIIIVLLFVTHIHEILIYTTIERPDQDALQCVTNFKQKYMATFNRASSLFHSLIPFFIQIIAITLLIVLAARSRAKTSYVREQGGRNKALSRVLKVQINRQKELYITPVIIVLSSLPQTILSFTLACTQLNDWKRHSLLAASLLFYTPQILGFVLHVLPSTHYKKEFSQTFIGSRFLE